MRTVKLAILIGAAMPLAIPAAANAQTGVRNAPSLGGSMAGKWQRGPGTPHGSRWGGNTGGHWNGGVRAPGGWNAYRQPVRGYVLPRYWIAPTFYVTDYQRYSLRTPPQGYFWVRYYDDAVLTNQSGQVWDTVPGVAWDQYDDAPYADEQYFADDGEVAQADDEYHDRYESRADERPDNGVGGAVIGGLAGAAAGNVIAGRGDKTAGTLLGAGIGAVAGVAIDKAEDRGQGDRGAPYPPPGAPGPYVASDDGSYASGEEIYDDAPCACDDVGPGMGYSSNHYATNGYYAGGGYISGGYYYPPVTTTTITISGGQSVVTENYVEEDGHGYSAKASRRSPTKRVYHRN